MKRLAIFLSFIPILVISQKTVEIKPIEDTFICESTHYDDANFGNWVYLWEDSWVEFAGHPAENSLNRRILLKYDFSSIPKGATIKSAKISLVKFDASSKPPLNTDIVRDLDLYQVTSDWEENEVTWNSAKNGISWSNPGGDYDNNLITSSVVKTNPFPQEETWDISDFLQDFLDGNNGDEASFLLKDRIEDMIHQTRFYFWSKESTSPNAPNITIEYELPLRGLYVDAFENILGNPTNENDLINFCKCQGINYIALYGLGKVNLNNIYKQAELKDFIVKAKNNGINEVAAMIETANSLNKNGIQYYNQFVANNKKEAFNAYHFEFQFWNQNKINQYYCEDYFDELGITCNEQEATVFAVDQLNLIKDEINKLPRKCKLDVFIGWLDEYQADALTSFTDNKEVSRIFPAVYRKQKKDGSINLYNYNRQIERLELLAKANKKVKIIPVLATEESSGNHLYQWLENNPDLNLAEDNYRSSFENEKSSSINSKIKLKGFNWYRYTDMPILNCNGSKILPRIQLRKQNEIDLFVKSNEISVSFIEESSIREGRIYNLHGTIIHNISFNSNYSNLVFDELNLSSGIYLLQVTSSSNSETIKFNVVK